MSFLQALSRFGPSAFQGYNDESNALFQQNQQQSQMGGADAYGAILRAIAAQNGGGPPQSMPSTGSFQPGGGSGGQPPSNVIPFQPGGIPQMKPMGMPSASPMPSMPPGGMPAQGGPPPQGPMGQPPQMPQPSGPPQMGGQPDSMARPVIGGGNMPQGQNGGLQNLTLQQIVAGIKQTNPNISNAAIGVAIDKFLPLMNVQAQMQYHQLLLSQGQQRLDQGQQRVNETVRGHDLNNDYRTARLAQFDQTIAQRDQQIKAREATAFQRMPPNIKAQADALRVQYQQDSMDYREAQRNASFHPEDPDMARAVSDARSIMSQSQQSYIGFLDRLQPGMAAPRPGGYVNGLPVAGPPTAPSAGGSPGAKPPASAPPQAPGQPAPVGKGPNGQPLFPLAPGQSWGGQGTSDTDAPPMTPERQRMADVRNRDQNSPLPAAPGKTPMFVAPAQLQRYASGGQKPLADMTDQDLAAVRDTTRQNRGRANIDQTDNSTLGRFIRALDEQRANSTQVEHEGEVRGNSETSDLYEQNDRATEDEKHQLLFRIAHALGIVQDDYLNPPDKAKRGSKPTGLEPLAPRNP